MLRRVLESSLRLQPLAARPADPSGFGRLDQPSFENIAPFPTTGCVLFPIGLSIHRPTLLKFRLRLETSTTSDLQRTAPPEGISGLNLEFLSGQQGLPRFAIDATEEQL